MSKDCAYRSPTRRLAADVMPPLPANNSTNRKSARPERRCCNPLPADVHHTASELRLAWHGPARTVLHREPKSKQRISSNCNSTQNASCNCMHANDFQRSQLNMSLQRCLNNLEAHNHSTRHSDCIESTKVCKSAAIDVLCPRPPESPESMRSSS